MGKALEIPTFSGEDLTKILASDEFARAWETFQVVYLPRHDGNQEKDSSKASFGWQHVEGVFRNLSAEDRESFCIENQTSNNQQTTTTTKTSPDSFFAQEETASNTSSSSSSSSSFPPTPYYCSFLVQKDNESLERLLSRVPVSTLHSDWTHEPCVWIFFGRTLSKEMQGRPEHTDSISHDGTWHYQVSGIKQWRLRPTAKLLEQWQTSQQNDLVESWKNDNDDTDDVAAATVDCHQGDILVINTRLWRHQTTLPRQTDPSVSYARDFWARDKPARSAAAATATDDEAGGGMTNVDGLYATNDIAAGTILFRETDMPDCELHRSKDNPNCELVELEDGTGAVVSLRMIAAGEFFCIAESDDDEDEEESEGDEEEEGYEDVEDGED